MIQPSAQLLHPSLLKLHPLPPIALADQSDATAPIASIIADVGTSARRAAGSVDSGSLNCESSKANLPAPPVAVTLRGRSARFAALSYDVNKTGPNRTGIHLPGYAAISHLRTSQGGSVALYTRSTIPHQRQGSLDSISGHSKLYRLSLNSARTDYLLAPDA